MKLIDREKLKYWINSECNPYGKPTLDFETSCKIVKMIDRMETFEMNEERLNKFLDYLIDLEEGPICCPIGDLDVDKNDVPWCCEEVCLNGDLCLKKWLIGETE